MIKYENKENGRFYYIAVEKDMLGDLVIRIVRGGANISVVRTLGFPSTVALNAELSRICKKREKRGYERVA